MGRTFDGGYAEFTSVPATQVIPFRSELDWVTLGAIPEMVQTAHGSLTVGLDAQPGQPLLIRGGTSSVGMATAILAKDRGLTVLSTTRQPDRLAALKAIGVDHVLLDDGDVAAQARAILPDGVQAAIELVGTNTLPDTRPATAVHGVVCFTGMLSNQWTVADFYLAQDGTLLGRLRKAALDGDPDAAAQLVMEAGPSTVRADTKLEKLAERMRNHNLQAMVVTTPGGRLLGVVRRDDAKGSRLATLPGVSS
jgi:NADPH:quinone reductase-like Zn-dependent oxidoreductase